MGLLFDLAATGLHTLSTLTEIVNEAGLRTRPTPTRPSRAVSRTTVHRILRDDYYTGVVTRKGVKIPGRHDAIVDQGTFQRVQVVLDSHRAGGERSHKHNHHLNGTLYCAVCGIRLGYGRHRGNTGDYYEYFSCLSRVRPGGYCGNPYAPVTQLETAVERLHARKPWLTAQEQAVLRETIHEFIKEKADSAEAEAERHERRLRELHAQQQKLVQLYYRDAVSLEVLEAEQQRIALEQAQAEQWQRQAVAQVDDVMEALDEALRLLSVPGEAYNQADASMRKLLNRAIFARILIRVVDRRVMADGEPFEVYGLLIDTAKALQAPPTSRPDIIVQAHQAVVNGPGRSRQPSRNEPHPHSSGAGFELRSTGGEGGIRTRERTFARYSLSRRVPSATRPPLRVGSAV